MQVTSRVKEIDFGSITRMTDDGTETMYLLKVIDEYGSVFQFLLGEPENYSSEIEGEAVSHFFPFKELMGYDCD